MTDAAEWYSRPGRRLAVSLLLAAFLVVAALSLLRYPTSVIQTDLVDLNVSIVNVPAPAEDLPVALPPEPVGEPDTVTPSEPGPEPPSQPEATAEATAKPPPPIDWQALHEEAAKNVVESYSQTASVNPLFEQKREAAATQFRASEAPEKRFIWDNVEKDYLGRTILVSGDCYRVLDDPSAVYRDVFETFTQYFVFCAGGKYVGRELPWVAEVRARHNYLQRQIETRDGVMSD